MQPDLDELGARKAELLRDVNDASGTREAGPDRGEHHVSVTMDAQQFEPGEVVKTANPG